MDQSIPTAESLSSDHLRLVIFPDAESAVEFRQDLLGDLLPEVPPEPCAGENWVRMR